MRTKRAFTLIELLVVITIIALLLSLLLPGLGSALGTARQAKCMSNVRQLVTANRLFAHDHDGHYVRAAPDIFSGFGGRKRWHGVREAPGVSPDPEQNDFDPRKGPLADYLGSTGRVELCPTFENQHYITSGGQNAFEAGTGGYGYNDGYIGGRYDIYSGPKAAQHSARTVQVNSPTQTVMFADAAFYQLASGRIIEYSFVKPPRRFDAPKMYWRPSIHFRHRDRAMVGWVDGHVTGRRMTFTNPLYQHLSQQRPRAGLFGWFGPDSNELFDLK
jgi:prepilin-type N-terminal cleavage/methylation domain-containing protein/prepilin-type processing-associated H-X9-DG protein